MKRIFYESFKDTSGLIYAEKQKEISGRIHFHRAFELAYILDGVAMYNVEGEKLRAEAGDIVFVHCCYSHQSLPEPAHTKYVIAVPENITSDVAELFAESTLSTVLSDKEFNRTLLGYFESLVNGKNLKIAEKGYANVIFGSLANHYERISVKQKNKNIFLIEDILDYIDAHCTEAITLESISEHFGYNKTYFSRLFNNHITVSLSNYINMVRYNKFEALVKENRNANITDLAFKCGFTSMSTFYRIRKEMKRRKNHDFKR